MKLLAHRNAPTAIVLAMVVGLLLPGPMDRAAAKKSPEIPPCTVTNSLGMTFLFVPPGTFLMGSPPDESGRDLDERQHSVTLTRGFYLQDTEVTQAQWKAVMGSNPSMMTDPAYPAINISADDALAFVQRLNRLEATDAYRLPTEAEWEWACRAGSSSVFPDGVGLSTDQANYDGNHPYNGYEKGVFRRGVVKVGSFGPNPWGFYDMSGNVWEWCQDTYGPYPSTAETDPVGPSAGLFKVVRGGSWYYDIQSCRCASRHRADPSKGGLLIGFRVAKSFP